MLANIQVNLPFIQIMNYSNCPRICSCIRIECFVVCMHQYESRATRSTNTQIYIIIYICLQLIQPSAMSFFEIMGYFRLIMTNPVHLINFFFWKTGKILVAQDDTKSFTRTYILINYFRFTNRLNAS